MLHDLDSSHRPVAVVGRDGRGDQGVHLVREQRFKQIAAFGEVAVERGATHPGEACHLGHRVLWRSGTAPRPTACRSGEQLPGGVQDARPVALSVGAQGRLGPRLGVDVRTPEVDTMPG